MKKSRLILTLFAALALFACNEAEPVVKPVLEVGTETMAFNSFGGERLITITANNSWTIEDDAEWISLNLTGGEGSAEPQQVMVYIDEYTAVNAEPRSSKITIKSAGLTHEVVVSQSAAEQVQEPETPTPEPPTSEAMEGAGTETDPYLIKTVGNMLYMRTAATEGGTTYFRMENDIDMAPVRAWIPVNYDNNFTRQIHFDGNNKTISNFYCEKAVSNTNYPSLFGVLYGSCKNLKIDKAIIISTSGCGIIGGYVGTGGKPGLVENVTITNSSVTNDGDRAGGVCGTAKEATFRNVSFSGTVTSTWQGDAEAKAGAFLGQAESTVVLENCKAEADLTAKDVYTGGLAGFIHSNATVSMTGCSFSGSIDTQDGYVGGVAGAVSGILTLSKTSSSGTVTSLGAYVGGLVGASMKNGVSISNCYSTADVRAWGQQVGGLVGTTTSKLTMSNCYASGDVYSTTSGAAGLVGRVQKSSTITNCIAWNKNVSTSRTANNLYAPGGVLGCAQEVGTYSGCIRRYDMVLVDEWVSLYDQPDYVNAMPPLPSYSTATHQQSYHGKAAAPGATIASVAQSLGWDSTIWNFASDGSGLGFTIKQLGDNKIEF